MKISCLAALLMLVVVQAHATPASVARSSELKSKPALDATKVADLSEGEQVEHLGNEGGWSKIKTAQGKTGYIRMLNLHFAASAGNSSAVAGLSTLGNVARTGSNTNVATTGVKGVTKEDLDKAMPNPEEVGNMERYVVSADEARKSAKTAKLSPQDIAMPEVKP
jgi:uncharacterized protein YgiM (DUF1202 family)